MTAKEFWDWFLTREKDIAHFINSKPDDYSVFEELMNTLNRYHELVIPELTGDKENNNILILSCDGRRDGIEPVERLFGSAPKIPGWKIQKFRAPGHVGEINYGGLAFESDAVAVRYDHDGAMYNIELFIRGYKENDDRYKALAFLYLDHFVGEYNVMTKVGAIEFKKRPILGGPKGTVTLQEFRAIVERLN